MSMLQIIKADKKEGKSKLNTAHVIYLIYSNEDCMPRNGLMPGVRKLMMLSRLLMVPGVEHAVQIMGWICACPC